MTGLLLITMGTVLEFLPKYNYTNSPNGKHESLQQNGDENDNQVLPQKMALVLSYHVLCPSFLFFFPCNTIAC